MNFPIPQHLSKEQLVAVLRAQLADTAISDIEVVEHINSTNSSLMQRSFLDHPRAGAMLWALTQTSGRGRRGRVWQSSPEHALTFSLSFEFEVRQHAKLSSLSPAAGLKLAMALSKIAPGVQVKWPNDLWRGDQKIAGVLLEATQRNKIQRIVIGIGVNVFWPKEEGLQSLAQEEESSSVKPQSPGGMFDQPIDIMMKLEVLSACARAMDKLHQEVQDSAMHSQVWFENWSTFDALAGQRVTLFQDQQALANGINAGVDIDGAFLMRPILPPSDNAPPNPLLAAPQRYEIGEISLRRTSQDSDAESNPVKIQR